MPDPNPAPKPLTCSPRSGWEFIFNLKNLYLVDGSSVALLDRYAYELLQPAERCAGGRDLYLALEDLRRIYAPDFDVLEGPEPGMRTIRHAGLEVSITENSRQMSGGCGDGTLPCPVLRRGGRLLVPAGSLMRRLGKHVSFRDEFTWIDQQAAGVNDRPDPARYRPGSTRIWAISTSPEGAIDVPESDIHGPLHRHVIAPALQASRRAHPCGITRRAFYSAHVDKCLTCELYLPFSTVFEPDKPLRCILLLPGANGTANTFDSTRHGTDLTQAYQHYAEERGFALVTVESYVRGGQYGDVTAPLGRTAPTRPDDPENPFGRTPGELEDISRSGQSVLDTLDFAFEQCPQIDRSRVYAVGLSMGGMGVVSLGVRHPELFAGLVAIAGMPCLDCLDLSPIAEVPLLYLFGSEDLGGQDFMLYAVRTLKRHLKRFSYKVSGGAVHGFEWQPYTRQIFDWIDSVAASEDGRASGHTH